MSLKASQAKTPETKVKHQVIDHSPLFGRANLILMAVGLFIIAAGMFLMAGGKNTDPNVFDYKQVYSTTRVTVAPILIVLGLVIEVYAIFKKNA
jgi:hypothetical protein